MVIDEGDIILITNQIYWWHGTTYIWLYQIKNTSCPIVIVWESCLGVLPHNTPLLYLMMVCDKVYKAYLYLLEHLECSMIQMCHLPIPKIFHVTSASHQCLSWLKLKPIHILCLESNHFGSLGVLGINLQSHPRMIPHRPYPPRMKLISGSSSSLKHTTHFSPLVVSQTPSEMSLSHGLLLDTWHYCPSQLRGPSPPARWRSTPALQSCD